MTNTSHQQGVNSSRHFTRKAFRSFSAIAASTLLLAPLAITGAQAATPKAGATCTKPGATTSISSQSYVCAPKSKGSKTLVWTLSRLGQTPSAGVKPTIAGGHGGEHGFGTPPTAAAMQAYQACLTKAGVTLPHPNFTRPSGTNPGSGNTGAGNPGNNAYPPRNFTRPTLTPAQQAAVTACQKANPTVHFGFGGPGGFGGRGNFGRPGAAPATGTAPAKPNN